MGRRAQAAMTWFNNAKLLGQRHLEKADRTLAQRVDRVLIKDFKATPVWEGCYGLETGAPLTSRDGIKRADYSDVSYERRVKYNGFVDSPQDLTENIYPTWQKRRAPVRSMLP